MLLQSHHKAWKYKYVINNFARFSSTTEDHAKLDIDTKTSALKAASSVVCLRSYSGDEQLFICSGFIIECDDRCGTFLSTILTSASLLRCASGAAKVADDLKIGVYMAGGTFFKGEVSALDFHYNTAIIHINSDIPLPTSTIRFVDGCVSLDLTNGGSVEDLNIYEGSGHQDYVKPSIRFSLYPGEQVLALGRYFETPYDIMIAPGNLSFGGCNLGCQELFRASCVIKKNGIGGPLINCRGEVIGINFYDASYTPFLPINIAFKAFEYMKKHGQTARPWIGLSVIQLYAEKLYEIEKICKKFPHVVKGAIVKKVQRNSPAANAGLCVGDVIIECDGNLVGSCLELTEALWNKKGKHVSLVVIRESSGEQLPLSVEAVKTSPKQYRWPVPKPCIVRIDPFTGACGTIKRL